MTQLKIDDGRPVLVEDLRARVLELDRMDPEPVVLLERELHRIFLWTARLRQDERDRKKTARLPARLPGPPNRLRPMLWAFQGDPVGLLEAVLLKRKPSRGAEIAAELDVLAALQATVSSPWLPWHHLVVHIANALDEHLRLRLLEEEAV